MEAIKTSIHTSVTSSIGPCTVRINPGGRCIVIILDEHPRLLIYVQADRLETCFLCHYVHIEDLRSTRHKSAEVQDWLQQAKLQLVRRYRGRPSDFARVAAAYAKSAAERMELWQGIDDGRRVAGPQMTFEEAKKWEYHFPRPNPPAELPPGGGGGKRCDEAAASKAGGSNGNKRSRGSR